MGNIHETIDRVWLIDCESRPTSLRSQVPLPGSSSTTMTSAASTVFQGVQSEFPPRTEHEGLPVNTTLHHQAQPEDTRRASGGSVGLCGALWNFFRVSFYALLCIPIRTAPNLSEHTPGVSLENLPFHILPVACRSNHHPE